MEGYKYSNMLLKLAAYSSDGKIYGGEKNIDFSGAIPSSFWYLHGKLENITGYDKAVMLNAAELGIISNCNETCINGIISVFIYNIIDPCIGYFWVEPGEPSFLIQRGYVCLLSDIEGRNWALEKLKANTVFYDNQFFPNIRYSISN